MNVRSLGALIAINVVLLAALLVTALTPQTTFAQIGGGGDEYLVISGRVQGRDQQAAVYVLNVTDGRVIALMYNSSNDAVVTLGGRDINRDLQSLQGGQR